MMEIRATGFADVTTERIAVDETDRILYRERVYEAGEPVGEIIYVRRRAERAIDGSTYSNYGWTEEGRRYLATKHNAIAALLARRREDQERERDREVR